MRAGAPAGPAARAPDVFQYTMKMPSQQGLQRHFPALCPSDDDKAGIVGLKAQNLIGGVGL